VRAYPILQLLGAKAIVGDSAHQGASGHFAKIFKTYSIPQHKAGNLFFGLPNLMT
jgi:hypothetical protein